ncbi:hypothetical protein EXIGLDRAFT_598666, partial [Exidia glandulosa HHB12029]
LPRTFDDTSTDRVFTRDITAEDVAAAKSKLLAHLKTQSGADTMSYSEIMSISNELLAKLFNRCIQERQMIALECCLLKMLTLIIDTHWSRRNTHIRSFAESEGILPESQNGFRPGYRTENNAFILRVAAEKAHRLGHPLYVTFVDLSNAFPSVNHSILWLKFIHSKITGPIID